MQDVLRGPAQPGGFERGSAGAAVEAEHAGAAPHPRDPLRREGRLPLREADGNAKLVRAAGEDS